MGQTEQRGERTDDLSWMTTRRHGITCFYCARPDPSGLATLGGGAGGPGAQIAVCAAGTGCRDGRIYHGMMADPHWPHESCDYCEKEADQQARRVTGNAPRRTRRGINRSNRHR